MQTFIMTLHNGVNDTFGSHADIKMVAIMADVATYIKLMLANIDASKLYPATLNNVAVIEVTIPYPPTLSDIPSDVFQ